ncbi:MAG: site-specific integrase [Actinobacteria bacterium]|nr:site-specific integrase [Actinomycetota bacterium]
MKHWIEVVPAGHKARIRYPNGKTQSKTFPTVREARAWLRRTLTEIDDGTYVPDTRGKLLFADWAAEFVAMSVDLAPGTINRRNSDLKNWVLPEFGHRPLGSITQPEVRTWVARMTKEGCNAGSVKLRYETLSTIFRAAVDAELIRRSPCFRVGLPRYERSEMRLLSLREIVSLSSAIHPRYRALILIAGTGGLRIGELGALRGRRIDLKRSTVEVAENLILDNGRPEFGPLKTKASHRKVPIPRQTLAAIEDHIQEFAVGRDDLLFTSVTGSLLRPYQFRRRHFHPAAQLSGLAPLRPHDLRHSAISLWIASGANSKVVQTKAGHASIKVTYDRYGHLFPDYDDRATRHLEELWDETAAQTNVVALRSRDDAG